MPSKFSLFAKSSKEIESQAKKKTQSDKEKADSIPAKDKSPDDMEIY